MFRFLYVVNYDIITTHHISIYRLRSHFGSRRGEIALRSALASATAQLQIAPFGNGVAGGSLAATLIAGLRALPVAQLYHHAHPESGLAPWREAAQAEEFSVEPPAPPRRGRSQEATSSGRSWRERTARSQRARRALRKKLSEARAEAGARESSTCPAAGGACAACLEEAISWGLAQEWQSYLVGFLPWPAWSFVRRGIGLLRRSRRGAQASSVRPVLKPRFAHP